MNVFALTNVVVFTPLIGALGAGLFGQQLGLKASHRLTITGMFISFVAALLVLKAVMLEGATFNGPLYVWATSGGYSFEIGYLIDALSATMMVVVTTISLLVHIYSIGYMDGDEGYQRFFSYMSAFTFAMLMLCTSNNFVQLFFGWEGVGVVSYLLIGFWYKRESALQGSLKAFLVNRVGDFGFVLGIAGVLAYAGSLDYATVFKSVDSFSSQTMSIFPGVEWSVMNVICILLFIGAMGKSAQVPLHVWLPESMEGPTPISALIHAATMVTAGIFMVSRMSPLYEFADAARSMVLVIGATGALFTGLIAIVQFDIKRVVAYSTLSQLGYMIAALGASAYAAGMFHLITHAFFKALLFLGAGSAIIAMHHEQDMRKMGNLKKYMPITYITMLIGSLSLAALPPFSGFFSKDAIIEAIHLSNVTGHGYATFCVTVGAFVTGLYTFRALFLAFHTQERMDDHTKSHLHESPWVVWLPLVILAVPSAIIGALMVKAVLYSGADGWFGNSLFVLDQNNVLAELTHEFKGVLSASLHAPFTLPFWLALGGIVTAWLAYIVYPTVPEKMANKFKPLYTLLVNKYGFDTFNDKVFVQGGRELGETLYARGDQKGIDAIVNGTGRVTQWVSRRLRVVQTGYLYHYAFAMMLGVLVFLVWFILR